MKRILTYLLLIILGAMLILPVSAAYKEEDMILLEEEKSIVIWVSWDVSQPGVIFIAPDGTEYDPTAEAAGTTTILSGKDLYYVIENAPSGQWRVRYDKGQNSVLDISVHDYQAGLFIESFALDPVADLRLPVHFLVGGPEDTNYKYRISAMIDHTGMEKELKTGSGRVGREVSETLRLDSLSTYSGYVLKLYVWYDDNGTDIFDFVFSEPFAVTNTSRDEKATDFTMTIQPAENLLFVSWPGAGYNAESVLVAVFEDGGAEPAFFDEYDPREVTSVQLSYDPAAAEVAVEVSMKIDGVNTTPKRRTAKLTEMGLTIPEGNAFSSVQLPLTYKGFSQQLLTLTVNGFASDYILDGDGTLSLTLKDDWNDLRADYTDGNGVTWRLERQIFVDRIPPRLTMSQSYDGIVLQGDKITISGTALESSLLTVNGEDTALSPDGSFSREITLSTGRNVVTVIARDEVGNESQYTAAITSGEVEQEVTQPQDSQEKAPGSLIDTLTAKGNYWVLLGASLLGLLLVVYALIFWRREGKK